MGRKGKRTKGIEEAHPFAGMSQVNKDAAGVDIGAVASAEPFCNNNFKAH